MTNQEQMKEEDQLWKKAQERVSFKIHLIIYGVINALIWGVWLLFSEQYNHVWPIYPMAGWGIGLFFHYIGAYHDKSTWVQKEYEKLKEERANP